MKVIITELMSHSSTLLYVTLQHVQFVTEMLYFVINSRKSRMKKLLVVEIRASSEVIDVRRSSDSEL